MSERNEISANVTITSTTLALIAFAANSVLCRMALAEQAIDAANFTIIRLCSGAIALLLILKLGKRKEATTSHGSWFSAAMLFGYASSFSFAYVTLDAGVGALILFGAVQLTMIAATLIAGKILRPAEWCGVAIAFGGLIVLVFPGLSAPSYAGFCLMAAAGVCWGVYTLRGQSAVSVLADTTFNFVRSLPLLGIISFYAILRCQLSAQGILLAILSGALTSGVGYAIWYVALKGLTAVQAGIVQLLAPLLAAVGGVLFLSELVTGRMIGSALMILGGIGLAVWGRERLPKLKQAD